MEYSGAVHQLLTNFKKDNFSVRRELLHNTLTKFGVQRKLVRLIKMCLKGECSKVHRGKH
jgi:hypothetical protein